MLLIMSYVDETQLSSQETAVTRIVEASQTNAKTVLIVKDEFDQTTRITIEENVT